MHKIDTDGSTTNREFTDGNIVKKIPATIISADWLNAVQNELVNVIGEDNLRKNNNEQLKYIIDAINNEITIIKNAYLNRTEVGKINIRICNKTNLADVSANEIEADGSVLKRDEYADLWRYATASRKIIKDIDWNDTKKPTNKLLFTDGDESTTFRVPLIKIEDFS